MSDVFQQVSAENPKVLPVGDQVRNNFQEFGGTTRPDGLHHPGQQHLVGPAQQDSHITSLDSFAS